MITFAKPTMSKRARCTDEQVNDRFVEMLPLITKIALQAFATSDPEKREESVQSVIVGAFIGLKLMAENGKLDEACATPLAKFAVARHCIGRPGGLPQNATDVTSARCQYLGRARVRNFGFGERISDTFVGDMTVADARYPVHKTVALRMDFFEGWYRQQSSRDQQIICDLAIGESTGDVAKKFNLSAPMISCLRKKYAKSWYAYINPPEETDLIDELKMLADEESTSRASVDVAC